MVKLDLVGLIPPDSQRVLEFACEYGDLGRRFKEINPSVRYYGIENLLDKAQQASRYLDGVFLIDHPIEKLEHVGLFKSLPMDCLVYHNGVKAFANSQDCLKCQLEVLKQDGQVICHIANTQYIKDFLGGHVVDEFSLKAIIEYLRNAGIYVYEIIPYYIDDIETNKKILGLLKDLLEVVPEVNLPENRFLIKGYIVRGVKGNVHKKLLLQTLLGETLVCSRVRVEEPHSFCRSLPGVKVVSKSGHIELCDLDVQEDKVFIRQRIWSDKQTTAKQVQALIKRGYLIIGEMDDDPMLFKEFHEENQFFAFRSCHGIQVSTDALGDFMKQYNPNVAVFKNQLKSLPAPRVYHDDLVTIFFGALNREADWQPLMMSLNQVLSEYEEKIQVKVIYDRKFFDALKIRNKEFIPFSPYEKYIECMRSSDIAILPLADNRFNRMKSDLKFIECAGHGVCVLASPIVYSETIRHGKTGFIYYNHADFELYLRHLIVDRDLRHEIADAAYEYVKSERLLCQHYKERYLWYKNLIAQLPQLNQNLIERIYEADGIDLMQGEF